MPSYFKLLKQAAHPQTHSAMGTPSFQDLREGFEFRGVAHPTRQAIKTKLAITFAPVLAPIGAARVYRAQKREEEQAAKDIQVKIDVYADTLKTLGFSADGAAQIAGYMVDHRSIKSLNSNDQARAKSCLGLDL